MTRPQVVGTLRLAAAFGSAVALTVALAQDPARSAFSAANGSSGNSVASATSFCTATGAAAPLPASADASVDDINTTTQYGIDLRLFVRAQAPAGGGPPPTQGNRRALLRFALPTRPTGCELVGATLRIYNAVPASGRTIQVYRADPADPIWTDTGPGAVNWLTQPDAVGTPVAGVTGAVAGWQQWTVTDHVVALYSGVNNGFVLRDQAEGSGASGQEYYSREATDVRKPELVLTWG